MSERRIRVLLVAPSLDILGGQAVQADRLLKSFQQEQALEVRFLPVNPRLPAPFHLLQRIKYVRSLVTSIWYVGSLLLRAPRHDILHIFSASYWSFLLAPTPALLIGKLYRKKTILNYRSGEAEDHLARWRSAVPMVRLANVVVVPSDYLVEVFARFGIPARAIFNIVDTSRFRFRKRYPLRPVFLSNRDLEPLYNVSCALRAFAIVQRSFPEARLTVLGDGRQRAELEQLAARLQLHHVRFLGRVAHEKMPEFYDKADIYLNSPNLDNMPGSILEAFAAGTPVVSTNAGGIPYIVEHGKTGLLAPCGDADALAANAIRLLVDPALARSISFAAREQCDQYSWAAVREKWLGLYGELCGGEPGATLPVQVQP